MPPPLCALCAVYILVHMSVCIVCMCACTCAEARGWWCLPRSLSTLMFWRPGCSLNLKHFDSARLDSQWAPGTAAPVSSSPALGLHMLEPQLFMWVLGVLMLVWQALGLHRLLRRQSSLLMKAFGKVMPSCLSCAWIGRQTGCGAASRER